jgi:uncharacterized protein YndB with AHSA1/START domain
MLHDNLRALRYAFALMSRTALEDPFSKDQQQQALRALTSIIEKVEKAHAKCAPGTSQDTLLKNRLRALRVGEALITLELESGSCFIVIEAPTAKVFEALTHKALIKRWQYGRDLHTEWEVGGSIRFTSAPSGDLAGLTQSGVVLNFLPNEWIQYRLSPPNSGFEGNSALDSITAYRLTPQGEHTRVELIHQDPKPGGFTPNSLQAILVALKTMLEAPNTGFDEGE